MKYKELDVVRTLKDFPEEKIEVGEIGTIVMTFTSPTEAYEVEFVDSNGMTKALCTILPDSLVKYLGEYE